jgi:hypothetical protein
LEFPDEHGDMFHGVTKLHQVTKAYYATTSIIRKVNFEFANVSFLGGYMDLAHKHVERSTSDDGLGMEKREKPDGMRYTSCWFSCISCMVS